MFTLIPHVRNPPTFVFKKRKGKLCNTPILKIYSIYSLFDRFTKHTNFGTSFFNAVLATTLFRCWHILCFFAAWSALITLLNEHGIKVVMQPTLLTAYISSSNHSETRC